MWRRLLLYYHIRTGNGHVSARAAPIASFRFMFHSHLFLYLRYLVIKIALKTCTPLVAIPLVWPNFDLKIIYCDTTFDPTNLLCLFNFYSFLYLYMYGNESLGVTRVIHKLRHTYRGDGDVSQFVTHRNKTIPIFIAKRVCVCGGVVNDQNWAEPLLETSISWPYFDRDGWPNNCSTVKYSYYSQKLKRYDHDNGRNLQQLNGF